MNDSTPNPYAPPSAPPQTNTTSHVPLDHIMASRRSRLAAKIIDTIIGVAIVLTFLLLPTGELIEEMASGNETLEEALITFVYFGLFTAIHGYLLATRGQTIGKYLLKIQIVDATNGSLVSLGRIIGLREMPVALAPLVSFAGANLFPLVDMLMIFGAGQRCVHDLIARTTVIYVQPST